VTYPRPEATKKGDKNVVMGRGKRKEKEWGEPKNLTSLSLGVGSKRLWCPDRYGKLTELERVPLFGFTT